MTVMKEIPKARNRGDFLVINEKGKLKTKNITKNPDETLLKRM